LKLTIHSADQEDVYKDIARIPEQYRVDRSGRTISEGRVCRVSVRSKYSYVLLRGSQLHTGPTIRLDERKRNELDLRPNTEADFDLKPVGLMGEFLWAWHASDPAYRISARLGVLSLALGVIGLVLGLLSLRH
jgi:hypothetical protein